MRILRHAPGFANLFFNVRRYFPLLGTSNPWGADVRRVSGHSCVDAPSVPALRQKLPVRVNSSASISRCFTSDPLHTVRSAQSSASQAKVFWKSQRGIKEIGDIPAAIVSRHIEESIRPLLPAGFYLTNVFSSYICQQQLHITAQPVGDAHYNVPTTLGPVRSLTKYTYGRSGHMSTTSGGGLAVSGLEALMNSTLLQYFPMCKGMNTPVVLDMVTLEIKLNMMRLGAYSVTVSTCNTQTPVCVGGFSQLEEVVLQRQLSTADPPSCRTRDWLGLVTVHKRPKRILPEGYSVLDGVVFDYGNYTLSGGKHFFSK
ncbi:hypothetical protein BDV93DRAFT_312598 [Ceratobasidium sp. AG-I]|nr:hypothetical protein BDV93DRAFT_312598 [Ceratobasidium sp. AG-I]